MKGYIHMSEVDNLAEEARKQSHLDALRSIKNADNPQKAMRNYLIKLGMGGTHGKQEAKWFFLYNSPEMPVKVVELMMDQVNSAKIPENFVTMSLVMTGIEEPGFTEKRIAQNESEL